MLALFSVCSQVWIRRNNQLVSQLNKAWAEAMSLLRDRVFRIHIRNKIKEGDEEETTLSPNTNHKEEIQHETISTTEEKLQRTR